MNYNPDIHHRRSIRLKGYDYSQVGAYFVTMCVQYRKQILGSVVHGEVVLSEAGAIVQQTWYALPARFPHVELDAFVVMPDHVHGVIVIGEAASSAPRSDQGAASSGPTGTPTGASSAPTGLSTLARVMRAWKSISAIEINRCLGRSNRPVWQRNYYERIIRNADQLERIRTYIEKNPQRWTDRHQS